MSQQSLNTGTGMIKAIDYATGRSDVDTGDPAKASCKINDPKGRFGAGRRVDARFSVDDANPTIHAGTGYPMCIPRTDPTRAGRSAVPAAEPAEPRAVTVGGATVTATTCRNFSDGGRRPPPAAASYPPAVGQEYCSKYVMPAAATRDGERARRAPAGPVRGRRLRHVVGHPDEAAGGADYMSAHTIEANVGIYTQPGKQPSYVAIGEFGVGSADPNATAAAASRRRRRTGSSSSPRRPTSRPRSTSTCRTSIPAPGRSRTAGSPRGR